MICAFIVKSTIKWLLAVDCRTQLFLRFGIYLRKFVSKIHPNLVFPYRLLSNPLDFKTP